MFQLEAFTLIVTAISSVMLDTNLYLKKLDQHISHDDVHRLVTHQLDLNISTTIRGIRLNQFDIHHPIDVYMLYKHWSSMTGKCDSLMQYLPNKEDFTQIVYNIIRLRDIYAADFENSFKTFPPTLHFENKDYVILGQTAFKNMNFKQFHYWYRKVLDETELNEDTNILKQYESMREKEIFVKNMLRTAGPDSLRTMAKELTNIPMDTFAGLRGDQDNEFDMFTNYKKLCQQIVRKKYQKSYGIQKGKCELRRRTMIDLLRPQRVEIYSQNPRVEVFYDLITPNTVNKLTQLTKNSLVPPLSLSATSGKIKSNSGRVGKTAFIDHDGTKQANELKQLTQKIRNIAENLIGLDSSYAENLQIVSYSIGGHYEPHVDYFNSIHADGDEDNVNTPNDRLSTMLFYLNEVEAGGATVFPLLNISVPPVAGSALYWENLDNTGSGNPLTLHAGCPVLIGQKEIANLWFWFSGQLRTCDL